VGAVEQALAYVREHALDLEPGDRANQVTA
jgi:hypothetical protein